MYNQSNQIIHHIFLLDPFRVTGITANPGKYRVHTWMGGGWGVTLLKSSSAVL